MKRNAFHFPFNYSIFLLYPHTTLRLYCCCCCCCHTSSSSFQTRNKTTGASRVGGRRPTRKRCARFRERPGRAPQEGTKRRRARRRARRRRMGMTTTTTSKKKLKVLCLHSFRTSADIMKIQLAMGGWDKHVEDSTEFMCIDGIFPATGEPPEDVKLAFPNRGVFSGTTLIETRKPEDGI